MKKFRIDVEFIGNDASVEYNSNSSLSIKELAMASTLSVNGIYGNLPEREAEAFRKMVLAFINNEACWKGDGETREPQGLLS